MANSYTEVTLTQAQTTGFTTPSYVDVGHLVVKVNDVVVPNTSVGATNKVFGSFTSTNPLHYLIITGQTSLSFNEALPSGAKVHIQRSSSQNSRLVDYSDASLLTADTMDRDANQIFFVAQEALDQSSLTNVAASDFYYSQGTEPATNTIGTLWYDTSSTPNVLKIRSSTGWEMTSPIMTQVTLDGSALAAGTSTYSGYDIIPVGSNFNDKSAIYLNGIKQVAGTSLGNNDYFQVGTNVYIPTVANTDVIQVISHAQNLDDVVNKSAAQTITGAKVFSANTDFSAGVDVTGDINFTGNDNIKWPLDKLQVLHNGATGYVTASTDLFIKGYKTELVDNNSRKRLSTHTGDSGNIRLYHGNPSNNNDWKLRTEATGIGVAGNITVTGTVDNVDIAALSSSVTTLSSSVSNVDNTSDANKPVSTATQSALNLKAPIASPTFTGTVTTNGLTVDLGTSNTTGTIQSSTGNAQLNVKSTANTAGDDYGIIEVSGTDGAYIDIAKPDGTGYDLRIQHLDENNSVVVADTSNLIMQVQDTSRAVILKHGANSPKLTTTTTGINVTGTVTADGLTLGDSEYIKIGEGNNAGIPDLQIFSGGGNAFIEQPSGSGNNNNLIIRGQNINLRNDADATLISTDNDQVRMWTQVAGAEDSTNGAAKFSTTTTGIDVNGTVTADALDIDGDAVFTSSNTSDQVIIENTSTSTTSAPDLKFRRSGAVGQASNIGVVAFNALNSTPTDFSYANIVVDAVNLTAGSETGKIKLQVADPSDGLNYPVPRLSVDKDGIDVAGTVTADGLNVDTSNNFATINVGTAYLNVIGSDATSGLKLSNTNNTTAGQSDILFQRTENPVVNGTNTGIGQMLFEADNSGGSPFLFAGITAYANQFTAGAEEAFFVFTVEDGTGSRNEKLRINKDGIEVTGTVTADSITSAPTTVVTTNNTVPTVAVNKKYIDTYDSGVNAYVLPTGTVGQMITFVNASTQNITLNRNTNSITLEKVIAGSDPANVTDATITVGKSGVVEVVYTGTNTAVIFGSGIS